MEGDRGTFKKSEYLRIINRPKNHILFHSLYGNPVEVDDSIIQMLSILEKPSKVDNFDKKTLDQLISAQFIIPTAHNEREMLNGIIEHRRKNFSSGYLIRNLQLNISELCNFACKYCIQKRSHEGGGFDHMSELKFNNKIMSWNIAKYSIDKFMNILRKNKNNKAHIMFFGGEPLTNWNVLTTTLDYIDEVYSDINVTYVITTNGSLLTSERAKKLKEHDVVVQISLDGLKDTNDKNRIFKDGRGTFDVVNRGIEELLRYDINLNLGVVISEESFDSITTKFIDYAILKGVKNIEINPEERLHEKIGINRITDKILELVFYGIDNNINVFSLLEIPLLKMIYQRQGFCSVVGSTLSIEPSGDVHLCRCLKDRIENVEKLDKILQSQQYKDMVLRIEGNLKGCKGCYIEGLCGGGCAANAEKLVGNALNKDSTRCDMTRKITYEELKRYGLRKLSERGKKLLDDYKTNNFDDDSIELNLLSSRVTFWDKEIIRKEFDIIKEKEYIPVRMINF